MFREKLLPITIATSAAVTACSGVERDPSQDLGIVPSELTSVTVEYDGSMYDPEGTTLYPVVSRLAVDGDSFEHSTNDPDSVADDVFQEAIEDNKELVEAAVERGTLKEVLLTNNQNEKGSHYNPFADIVVVNLEEDGISYDELSAVTSHEMWHAITADQPYNEAAWNQYYEPACNVANQVYISSSIEYVRTVVDDLDNYLETQKAAFPAAYEQYEPILDGIAEYMDKEDVSEDVMLYCGQLSVRYTLGDVEEAAFDIGEDGFGKFGGIIYEDGLFDSLADSDPLKRAIFREFIEGDTVYADFNEASYVQSESEGVQVFGHTASADNFSELYASILNILTRYPEEFGKKIALRKEGEQTLALTYTRLIIDDTIAANPGLAEKLTEAEARFMTALYGDA